MKQINLVEDSNDSWAQVELYRWQYGELPSSDIKELNESVALEKMAKAIEVGDRNNFPTPFNVVSVLRYVSKLLSKNK